MKLSIIIPVNNLENYIATTLDSFFSIRFSSDYEIIVINDGSTGKHIGYYLSSFQSIEICDILLGFLL